MKEQFIERKFNAESQKTITIVNAILEEYRRQGFRLSLRQLYYQLVARDYIPNNLRSYKNLGNLVSTARQAGLIDWGMIEDRNRETASPAHWENPAEIVQAAAQQFRIDKWRDQPYHIEVMVEKDALSGVLEPVCRQLDIGITANKGYCSVSTMYEIGKRLAHLNGAGKEICIIYLGDHDPSGIDMTRDVRERLAMYTRLGEDGIDVARLALNWEQIEIWQPPENPAKETDSRYATYVDQFGESSYELDAVEPRQLADLVRQAVAERLDQDAWDQAVLEEQEMRNELQTFVQNYKNGRNGHGQH
jgi:hypothetical protein